MSTQPRRTDAENETITTIWRAVEMRGSDDEAVKELREYVASQLAAERVCSDYWGVVWANMERLRPFFFNRNIVLKPDGSFDGGAMVVVELKAMDSQIKALTTERDALLQDRALADHCRAFIAKQQITCAECVHQSDRVIENAYGFIEGVCNLAGYHKAPDEDNEVADSMRQAPVD
jgi:hypothetical protein